MDMIDLHCTQTRLLACLAVAVVLSPWDVAAQRRLPMRRVTATVDSTGPGAVTTSNDEPSNASPVPSKAARVRNDSGVRHAQHATVITVPDTVEPIEPPAVEGEWIDTGVVVEEGAESCSDCLQSQGWGSHAVPCYWADHLSFFGGAHAFKNDANLGLDGSFGFHYGLNFGAAAKNIILPASVGWQIGAQFTDSNLNAASFTTEERQQVFLTAGLYRRGDYGLQGGLVVDFMWDDWYFEPQINLSQLRGELSLAITPRKSLGFRFATSLREQTVLKETLIPDVDQATWTTKDRYIFFYRTRLFGGCRGEGTLFAGFTGEQDGIIGGKSRMPLHNGWALETDYTYIIPDESEQGGFANYNESWNVALNLVWYPGSMRSGCWNRYHRPMFDVANNGTMIIRRKPDGLPPFANGGRPFDDGEGLDEEL